LHLFKDLVVATLQFKMKTKRNRSSAEKGLQLRFKLVLIIQKKDRFLKLTIK